VRRALPRPISRDKVLMRNNERDATDGVYPTRVRGVDITPEMVRVGADW